MPDIFLSILRTLSTGENALLMVVFMSFCVVGFSLYVLMIAIKTLSKRDGK